ncbi:MAG: chorismate-binding protein, partial [Muribaculaceae bacterium]|nr:chorismate-binding protein [Muribaculaceae bacterium]
VGLQPMVHRAETVKHGDVRHLRHMITAEGAEGKFDQLVGMLSPTPALAGWPVGTSIDEIGRTEKHPRYCYGGYIVVPDAGGRRRAYVNLRSFHFYRDRYCIYAGGGITGLSDVGEEWQEAEAKSAPLQRILMTGSEAVSV